MKIAITFTEQESEKAAAAVFELSKLFPFRRKTTPPKDGYIHTYLSVREPLSVDSTTQKWYNEEKTSTARKS